MYRKEQPLLAWWTTSSWLDSESAQVIALTSRGDWGGRQEVGGLDSAARAPSDETGGLTEALAGRGIGPRPPMQCPSWIGLNGSLDGTGLPRA